MSRPVFISYSSQDKAQAEAVAAALEAAGVGCWIAHRDNTAGTHWDEGILDAIDAASIVVLILSAHANASGMVKREIERAASRNIHIVPLRVEDVPPGRSLEFFIHSHHWLDAFPPPLAPHLPALVESVRRLLQPAARSGGASEVNVYPYMISRGPAAHRAFTARPAEPWDPTISGSETVENLRAKLVQEAVQLARPIPIKVQGTLFPCALLSSGWWERRKESKIRQLKWRDGLQQWLFHGFDLWGPSWDFTWDVEHWAESKKRPYFIAQLGDGDEANSIPVLLPAAKALRLQEAFNESWGGIEAEVSGVLGHRKHFAKYVDPGALELFGGLLDYCLWLDDNKKTHVVAPKLEQTQLYSGYLWKCVAPAEVLKRGMPCLNDVYFIWEHVNFADRDALAYSLEAMQHKQQHIARKYGDLVLVQKSCAMVPGEPALAAASIYGMLLGKSREPI